MNQPLSYIHPEAKIAQGVVIEPFAVIHKDVEIGQGSWIGSHTTIMEGARIGKNVKIFPGAVISAVPQDLKFSGEYTTAIIGDNTSIREYVTVSRGTADKHQTVIGSDCLIMAYVHVAHDCIIGDNCILANAVQLAGHVHIGEWAILGGTSAVHQFVRIGSHAMISGGCLITKDVPPFVKAARDPISYCGINSVGLRRRGFSNDKIGEIQELYRIMFMSGYNNQKALEKIEMEMNPSKERDEIINFIKASDRGILKGYASGQGW